MVENLPGIQETQAASLSHEDPLEKGMATHSSILAWRIPWTLLLVLFCFVFFLFGFPGSSDSKESAYNAGDLGSVPGSGRFQGEGNGNPLQYSCLRGAWRAAVHEVMKSWTRLSSLTLSLHSVL